MADSAFGLYTWFGYVYPFDQKLRFIKEAGFSTICTWWDDSIHAFDGPLEQQVEQARCEGLVIEHAHLNYFRADELWMPGPQGDELVAEFKRLADRAADCQVPTLVMHPYNWEGREKGDEELFVERTRDFARHCAKLGVRLAIENLDDTANIDNLVGRLVDDNPYVGICFDSGHANVSNPGDFSVLEHFSDRVWALHLHDNNAQDDQHLLPFDQGCTVDWDAFTTALDATSYQGSIMLESCYPFDFSKYDTTEEVPFENPACPVADYLADAYSACARIQALRS